MIVRNSVLFVTLLAMVFLAGSAVYSLRNNDAQKPSVQSSFDTITKQSESSPAPTPTPTIQPIPQVYIIPQQLHVFQTFNNCGPATLSMALSYLGENVSQVELGQILRPYQIPGGDNDDKSVTLHEVAQEAERRNYLSYLRPNGTIETLKRLLVADVVVVARTWLGVNEDIGHYRVIRGYDDTTNEIIQDDSLQGKNLRYAYDDFLELWQPFNYEYLVIIPVEKKVLVEQILGTDVDEQTAWLHAKERIEKELQKQPDNWHLLFALSRIHYYLGNYATAVTLFNQVESRISFRTLWYQIEPILAMYETGDYERVLRLTTSILYNQNRAFSELYFIRGKIYENQGFLDTAREEYKNAVRFNKNNSTFADAVARTSQ